MTSLPPTTVRQRRMRGRLLVVGNSEVVRDFASTARRHIDAVSEVANLYDALAELSKSRAREPIAAIAICSECESFDAAVVVQSFARVDSSVPIVLLFPLGQEELSAITTAEGFEDSIPLPASNEEVVRVFTELRLIESPASRMPETPRMPEVPRTPEAPRIPDAKVVDLQIAKAMAQAHPETQVAPVLTAPVAAESPSNWLPKSTSVPPAQTPAPNPIANRNLRNAAATRPAFTMPASREPRHAQREQTSVGDVTLVRAIMDGDNLREIALQVLKHHLHSEDLRLVPPPRPGEEDAIARERTALQQASVQGRRGCHGILLSAHIDLERLASWANWLAQWLDLDESHREFRRLTWTDELTGAGNRRALNQMLPEILDRSRAERRPVSLMYFDIDDFKQYNERFGHAAGDEVLRETVEVLKSCIRPGDHLFRMGGDEFVILFCDPNGPRHDGNGVPESVQRIAERCRVAVRALQVTLLGSAGPGAVTMSAGCALSPWEALDAQSLIQLADERALRAKLDGKDQINFGPNPNDGFSE